MVSPSPMVRSGTTSPASLSGLRLEKASTSAPVCSTSRLVPGEWSGCVWVNKTQRTRSRIDAPTMASMWPASSGPGSMTATSSMPTRYVLVPGPVNGPGFGATIRRTRGESALGTPGVRSGTSAPPRAGAGERGVVERVAFELGVLDHVEGEHPALTAVDAAHRFGIAAPHVVDGGEQLGRR